MSKPIQKELSISRWHKVVKRLAEERAEKLNCLQQEACIKPTNLMKGIQLEPGITIDDISTMISEIEDITIFICQIKTAINSENAKLGIADNLAEADGISYMLQVLNETIARTTDFDRALTRKQAQEALKGLDTQTETGVIRIDVKPISKEEQEKLVDVISSYKIRRDTLMDEISDLNKNTFSMDVPEAFTRFV